MNAIERIQKAESDKLAALAKLHVELGYSTPAALASAILAGAGTNAPSTKAASAVVVIPSGNSRKGHRIPDATRKAIITALKAGEKGVAVAAKFSVSYPTIHNIKTELGLVKARS